MTTAIIISAILFVIGLMATVDATLFDWDLFQVPEKEFADEWDGHTPQEAAERLHKYLQQEQLDVDKIKREWYNKGYLEGRKNAHIPARELGLPKSWDFQQEQPEVDIEKEIEKGWEELEKDYSPSALDKSYIIVSGLVGEKQFSRIARHFYELGELNTRKKE